LAKHIEITSRLLILEDGLVSGGIGHGIVNQLLKEGMNFQVDILGVSDKFPEQGSLDEVCEDFGLGDEQIRVSALSLINR
jgi:1-deoxy-D-xylulose-5-phosphate synthase